MGVGSGDHVASTELDWAHALIGELSIRLNTTSAQNTGPSTRGANRVVLFLVRTAPSDLANRAYGCPVEVR
jgi:hypothetical protein